MPTGRPRTYDDPEELEADALRYFDWCDQNPWYKKELLKGGDLAGLMFDVPIPRPYTWEGLATFIGVTSRSIRGWKNDPDRKDFFPVLSRIGDRIHSQKLEGATIGLYNPGIVARDLGLVDKQEVTKSKITIRRKGAKDQEE